MNKEIIISVIIGLVIGLFFGFFLFNQETRSSQNYEDFVATAGETWNNVMPFRYTSNSCEEWFVSLNVGDIKNLDYCFIKDFEVRDDTTPSTINCRCWLK